MSERTDVIVVGARCAGAPLAALLARAGVRVSVLERAQLPSDTLSSHIFEMDALAFLARMGVIERVLATGAPLVNHTQTRIEDLLLDIELPRAPGDPGGMMSVRRTLFDEILVDAAADAGAQVRMGARVSDLLSDDAGRVNGVRFIEGDSEHELRARLVVGADGRQSTVARLAGARRYNVTPNQRLLLWAYYEGADTGTPPRFLSHRWEGRFTLGIPCDSGLYQVLVMPELTERTRFQSDRDAAFIEHARACEPIADALAGAKQLGKAVGAFSYEGFFREGSGRGWVLCGDAGHFKSPAPGRGIGDAFLQAQQLASTLTAALAHSDEALDRATHEWVRWREREFAEHYWLAYDLEEAGLVPAVLVELLARLRDQGKAGLFFDVLNHRARPVQVLSPARLLAASARLLARSGTRRRELLARTGTLGARDMRRRALGVRPAYATAE